MRSLEPDVQEVIETVRARTGVPGISVAMSVAGERLAVASGSSSAKDAHPLGVEARFQLGCITKLLTSVVALSLGDSGCIDLDAPIIEYLPEVRGAATRDVTVSHLASHTSGYCGLNVALPEVGYFYSWDKLVHFLCQSRQVFQPGSVFNYEHTECVLLGEILHRATSVPPEQLVREMILEPLQLRHGTVRGDASAPEAAVADHVFDASAGAYVPIRAVPYCSFWRASLSDFTASPLQLLQLGELLNGVRPIAELGPRALNMARASTIGLPAAFGGPCREELPEAFGYGSAHYRNGLSGHNGSGRGQTCGLRFDEGRELAIVVALNAWRPDIRDLLLTRLSELACPTSGRGKTTGRVAPTVRYRDALELAGTYEGCVDGLEIRVARVSDQIECRVSNKVSRTEMPLTMAVDADGSLTMTGESQHFSVGFFSDPVSGAPCLMLGLNAFRKTSEEGS